MTVHILLPMFLKYVCIIKIMKIIKITFYLQKIFQKTLKKIEKIFIKKIS